MDALMPTSFDLHNLKSFLPFGMAQKQITENIYIFLFSLKTEGDLRLQIKYNCL